MQYAKIIENGVLIKNKPANGYKPVEEIAPEDREGFVPVSHYEDRGDKVVTVWDYVELPPVEEPDVPTTADKAEAYDILMGEEESE